MQDERERDAQQDGEGAQAAHPGHHVEDISDTPAPSVGPHTTFEKPPPPEERAAQSHASNVDAMGLDKRRQVTGGTYGPTRARQLTLYGIAIAVIVALAVGFKLLTDELDRPPETNADAAPWADNQIPPRPLQ